MGAGWRRFTERLHQTGPSFDGGFQATSNARCSVMLREASEFMVQLKKAEKAISSMAAANVDGVSAIKTVMCAPLPRRYEETAVAAGGAASGSTVGGEGFSADGVTRAMQSTQHKLETEVLAPLHRWQEVYMQLGTRFKELESTRLEVDSRRRTVADLSHKVDALRAKLGRGGDAKQEGALEETIKRLQHKEAKLQVVSQTYVQQEQLLHRDFSTLIVDAQYLKAYAAAALRLEGHALLAAADAFGLQRAPSPPPARQLAATVGPPPAVAAMAPGMPSSSRASSAAGSAHAYGLPAPATRVSAACSDAGTPVAQPLTPLQRLPVTAQPVLAEEQQVPLGGSNAPAGHVPYPTL